MNVLDYGPREDASDGLADHDEEVIESLFSEFKPLEPDREEWARQMIYKALTIGRKVGMEMQIEIQRQSEKEEGEIADLRERIEREYEDWRHGQVRDCTRD